MKNKTALTHETYKTIIAQKEIWVAAFTNLPVIQGKVPAVALVQDHAKVGGS